MNETLRADLEGRYGRQEAERIYGAMVAAAQGPFAPGAKYHGEHVEWAERNGVPAIESRGMKKPRASRPGSGRGARGRSFHRKR